jgi:hypothetical protein
MIARSVTLLACRCQENAPVGGPARRFLLHYNSIQELAGSDGLTSEKANHLAVRIGSSAYRNWARSRNALWMAQHVIMRDLSLRVAVPHRPL